MDPRVGARALIEKVMARRSARRNDERPGHPANHLFQTDLDNEADLVLALEAALDELERKSDHEDFLAYMTGELREWPCLHGDAKSDGDHTPPMMWPEWVACIVRRAVKDALAAARREEPKT